MDYAYPPIPAGEKIIIAESYGVVYPIIGDDKKVKQWNFAIICDGFIKSGSIIQLSDGDINWASEMSKISDPQTKKESFITFDDKQIYIISDVDGKNQLVKKPRVDGFVGKNAFFSICPLNNSEIVAPAEELRKDPIIKPSIKLKSFYCGYSKDSTAQNIVLYDFLDDKFSTALPFKPASNGVLEISLLSRITSYKNTYVIFVATEVCSDDKYMVSLYAITEKDLVQKSSTLTIDDFITNKLTDNSYPVSIFVDHFYYDEKNTGSSQFVVCLNNASGDTILLQMFEIDETPKIVKTASYTSTYSNSLLGLTPIQQRKRLAVYLITEHGPIFFLSNTALELNEACSLLPVSPKGDHAKIQENGSRVHIDLINFDSQEKNFIKKSSTIAFAHYALLGLSCGGFPISGVTFSNEMPLISYASVVPTAKITNNDSGGLSISLDHITVYCAIMGVRLNSLNQLSGIQTTATSKHTKLLFKALPIEIIGGITFKPIQNISFRNMLNFAFTVTDTNITTVVNTPLSEITDINRGLFFQAGADLAGDSIILGTPNLSFGSNLTQITGFYRALPFQEELKKANPLISVSSSQGQIKGVVDSVNSNWQSGYNASASFSREGSTVAGHFGKSFGGHNMTMSSDTRGVSLHSVEDLSSYDLVTGYGADFYLWEYPVYRHTADVEPVDFLTILVPVGYSQQSLDAKENNLGYFQDYEIGNLLTYIGSELPGYSEEGLLFTPATMTVTGDSQGGMSLVYDKNSSTSKEKSRSSDTSVNAGFGLNLFGILNISGQYTKSTNRNKSVHATQTLDYSVTFHSGTVSDSQYEYKMTPLVYRHKDSKALVTTCRVELEDLGSGWKNYFASYDVRLMRSFPYTSNKTLRAFSESIRFDEQPDKTVNISVHIFNNSLYPAKNIKCDIYLGQANFNVNPVDISKLKHLGTLPVESMEVVERKVISLNNQLVPKKSFITVKILVDDLTESAKYFWGAYPYGYVGETISKKNRRK